MHVPMSLLCAGGPIAIVRLSSAQMHALNNLAALCDKEIIIGSTSNLTARDFVLEVSLVLSVAVCQIHWSPFCPPIPLS